MNPADPDGRTKNPEISYQHGIPDSLRDQATQLYDEAFGAKFAVAIPDRENGYH